jgi:hypothetical protein
MMTPISSSQFSVNHWQFLPVELPYDIFKRYMDDLTFIAVRSTCKSFHVICASLLKGSKQIQFKGRGDFIFEAVRRGFISLAIWAQKEKGMCREADASSDASLCAALAEGGHLALLQQVVAGGCRWDYQTCENAARAGHLEVLQWAKANGCPENAPSYQFTPENEHIEVLEWPRVHGGPSDAHPCQYATIGGRLEVIQWISARGRPWNGGTLFATRSNAEVFERAMANEAPQSQ